MQITAMLTPTAPTLKDRSTACVIRDTLEMESSVSVKDFKITINVLNGFCTYCDVKTKRKLMILKCMI